MQKIIRWNEEKNIKLKLERGIGFEVICALLEENKIADYAYCVPFIETDDEIFLKTIFISSAVEPIR